ncbi:MAG: radical SAM protein, partial [Eubacterium sp.]|nr:radical SAM protein [Eubacterium sp.]
MELYDAISSREKELRMKASASHVPLGGTFELTPLCNMDCDMCYVRLSKSQMDERGSMLPVEKWIDIARQGAEQSLLFILLTGGEPLLYPGFKTLYHELRQMGMIVSLNTNGTLLTEEYADFLAAEGVRRISITLYGKDNETYADLCKNPQGFTQVTRGFSLLKERGVDFRISVSLTDKNLKDLPYIEEIAREFEAPLHPVAYMFPAVRRQDGAKDTRLSPKEAAHAVMESYRIRNPESDIAQAAFQTMLQTQMGNVMPEEGFSCTVGKSGFWINWLGEMLFCGMFSEPKMSLRDHTFRECWNFMVSEARKVPMCSECRD